MRRPIKRQRLCCIYCICDDIKNLNIRVDDKIVFNAEGFELLSEDVKNIEKGYERFLGYANTYDEGRPKMSKKDNPHSLF